MQTLGLCEPSTDGWRSKRHPHLHNDSCNALLAIKEAWRFLIRGVGVGTGKANKESGSGAAPVGGAEDCWEGAAFEEETPEELVGAALVREGAAYKAGGGGVEAATEGAKETPLHRGVYSTEGPEK